MSAIISRLSDRREERKSPTRFRSGKKEKTGLPNQLVCQPRFCYDNSWLHIKYVFWQNEEASGTK